MRKLHIALFTGDRNWGDSRPVRAAIRRLRDEHGSNLLIITGGAPGLDTLARILGHEEDVHVAEVDALWGTRHRAAGPQRNDIMLAVEPNEAFAFHPNLVKSKGTKDMVKKCKKAGIPVHVYPKQP